MTRIKTIGGIIWLLVFLFAGIFLFMKMQDDIFISNTARPFSVPVHFSGGDILVSENTGPYVFVIRDVVWSGLFQNGKQGFVQVQWIFPGEKAGVDKEIITFPDGKVLGEISIDSRTETAAFSPSDPSVLGLVDNRRYSGNRFMLSRNNKGSLLNQDNWYSVRIFIDRNKWEE